MPPIVLIMNWFTHCNIMGMSELIVVSLQKNVKFIHDYGVKLVLTYCIMKMYIITSIIIYIM